MEEHYQDYVWQEGIPLGKQKLDPKKISEGDSYRIIQDPYRKRISIEQYSHGKFIRTFYDSALLNFRKLKPAEQMVWNKVLLEEEDTKTVHLIRDQDDRAVFMETSFYKEGWCLRCEVQSIHGVPVSIHCTYRKQDGDDFDGVVLYDTNQHPVMYKIYATDPETGEFTELLKENWKPLSTPGKPFFVIPRQPRV